MVSQDILFETVPGNNGDIGLVTLNRPQALNALTLEMITALQQTLIQWNQHNRIKAVVVRSNSPKAFCAGGDIRALYDAGKRNDPHILSFFWEEYRLNHYIHHYPKPYICLVNGITMGGGVGISLHGSHVIAGENFSFAMPETAIGFFPDIGGSHLLNHCVGEVGTYLGLSGARVKQDDASAIHLIKHCVPSHNFEKLLNTLCDANLSARPHDAVTEIIERFQETPAPGIISEHRTVIDEIFNSDDIEVILQRLATSTNSWASKVSQELKTKCPSSMKITLQQLRQTKGHTLAQCLQLDYRIVARMMHAADFYEGVRAVIIDKDNAPKWQPMISDASLQQYFAPLAQELEFIAE